MRSFHVIVLLFTLLAFEKCCAEGEQGTPDILFPGWSSASGTGQETVKEDKPVEPSNNAPPTDGAAASASPPPPPPPPPPASNFEQQGANDGIPPVPPGMPNGVDTMALMREHLLRQAAANAGGHQHNQRPTPPHVPPYSAFQALNKHAAEHGHQHPHMHQHPHAHQHPHMHQNPHAHQHAHAHAHPQPGDDSEAQRRMLESFHSDEVQRRLREIEANYERERAEREGPAQQGSIWSQAFSLLFGFGPRPNEGGMQTQSEAQSLFFIPLLVAMVFAYFVFNCVRISSQWRDEQDDDNRKKHKKGRYTDSDSDIGLGSTTRGLSEMLGPALLAALSTDKQKQPDQASTQQPAETKPVQPQPQPPPQPQPQPPQATANAGVSGSLLAKDVGKLSLEELIALQQTLLGETLKRQQIPAATASSVAAPTPTPAPAPTPSIDEGGLRKRVVHTEGNLQPQAE